MRRTLYIVVILLLINVVVFIFRNNGFEYREFSTAASLCSPKNASSSIIKWNRPNENFSAAELNEGAALLKKETNAFATNQTQDRAVIIAGWLYHYYKPYATGRPLAFMDTLTPLQQFYAVLKNRSPVWCGNYQAAFGFFCTAAGIKNRYIQLVDMTLPIDHHVVNEIYLPVSQKWAMVDVTYNRLMVYNDNGQPLCAAGYYDLLVNKSKAPVLVVSQDSGSVSEKTIPASDIQDSYFDKDHRLHYYYETDLKKSYSSSYKLKRYVLPDPWYVIYPRLKGENNLLFYLKEFLVISLLLSLILLVYLSLKKIL